MFAVNSKEGLVTGPFKLYTINLAGYNINYQLFYKKFNE